MADDPDPKLSNVWEAEFLPPVHRWMKLGGLFLVVGLGGAVVLAGVVKYNVTVKAAASVRPVGEVRIVQAAAAGRVRQVKVRQNQMVQQGDILAEVAIPQRSHLRTLESRQTQIKNFIRQHESDLVSLDRQLQAVDRTIVSRSGLPPAPVAPVQAEQPMPPGSYIDAALERLARSDAGTASYLTLHRDRLLKQRLGLVNQLRLDRDALQEVSFELEKQVLRAPVDGTILKLNLTNAGQTIQPGDVIAQIVPRNVPLVVKAKVAAQDISKVEVNQDAQMRVSAYPYPDYGVLKGSVQAIAPDVVSVPDPMSGLPTPYYEVTIQPEYPFLTKGDRQYPLQPGMEVTADIISRQETLLQFLLRRARLWTDL